MKFRKDRLTAEPYWKRLERFNMVYNTKKKRYVTVQNYDHEDHGKSKDSALGPRSLSCICQKKGTRYKLLLFVVVVVE